MKKRVVYILGAGFSAPLGVPVMSNFVDKARLLHREDEKKYEYFEEVISSIQDTIRLTGYFSHDSTNIEEALSVLEMQRNLNGEKEWEQLQRFIKDVIKWYTPPVPRLDLEALSQGWHQFLFTKDQRWQGYCSFIASLFGLQFFKTTDRSVTPEFRAQRTDSKEDVSYSLISFNYDRVLENVCQYINESFRVVEPIKFSAELPISVDAYVNPRLVKIHGDVEGEILPPTFIKGLFRGELPKTWKVAHDLIMQANHIRIIGYSLPQTDAYVKFLLKSAIGEMRDLDKIDWISLDDEKKSLESRFQEFVTFKDRMFKNGRVEHYLGNVFGWVVNRAQTADSMSFSALEEAHEDFMQSR